MLTRDELVKPRTRIVEVEGGQVTIRALMASEAMELRGKDLQSAEIFGMIAKSIVDPVLSAEDVGMLPTALVTQLTQEIFLFNALGEKAIAEAQEELKKTQTEEQPTL